MQRSTMVRSGVIGAACALVGAAAGIAGSSASSTSPQPKRLTFKAGAVPGGPLPDGRGLIFRAGPLGDGGPPVHSDAVIPNEKGGFDTVTTDSGRFSSLTGDQLTITEGTKTATYKTVTLTIPAAATVRRNDELAHLSDLRSADTVMVMQGPKGTDVIAEDAQHADRMPMGVKELKAKPGQVPSPPLPPGTAKEGSTGEGSSSGPETRAG